MLYILLICGLTVQVMLVLGVFFVLMKQSRLQKQLKILSVLYDDALRTSEKMTTLLNVSGKDKMLLHRMNDNIDKMRTKINEIKSQNNKNEHHNTRYDLAKELIKAGKDVDAVMLQCGLTRDEVQILTAVQN